MRETETREMNKKINAGIPGIVYVLDAENKTIVIHALAGYATLLSL